MAEAGPGEAIELGVTYLSVVGETSKLARSIRDAVREGQRYVDRHPLNLRANIDVSHIGAVEIPVLGDTDRFDRSVRAAFIAARRYAERHPIDIDANVHVAHTSNVTVDVVPDFSQFADRMDVGLALAQAGHNWTVTVGVDLDSAAAIAQMRALRAALEAMATPIEQNVNVDVDRDSLDRLRGPGGLGSLAKGLGVAAGGAAAIAAIGGAAGAALGAVGALGVGIAALGPAAAAAGATVAVGVQGIGDAFKALSAATESAGADSQAQAQAIAAAQDQVVAAHEQVQSAIEGVQDAQRTLTEAQKDARDATVDIARAYKDAADELEDYHLKLRDASLSEKEAELALREARAELAKAPPDQREKAFIRLERAQLRYDEAQERGRDVTEEANDALAKGVEGSDKVVAAKDRAAQADQRVDAALRGVEKANQQVEKANRQVEKAQQALTDATTKTSAAQDKAAQALAKLSPEARAWVLAVREMSPAWTDLKNAVQDSLFDDAAQGIRDLATAALPTLKAGMVDVAGSMNGLTKQFAAFWAAPQNLAGVQSIFAGTANFIDGLGPGLQQATQGFLSMGKAFEPVANKVGAQVGNMFGQIGQAFTDAFDNGSLTQLFSTFGDIIEGLGQGLKPFIKGLIDIGNIVGPTIGPLFKALGESFLSLAPALGKIGATFVTTLTALMPDLTRFIDALLVGLEPVLPVLGDLLASLSRALIPLIGPLSQIAQTIGNALVKAVDALAPSIGPMGEAFSALVTALAPIIPVIATVVSGLIQALAPALKVIFSALGPVIQLWAELLMPVLKELQPILADVAMKIAVAIGNALEQIAPMIPDIARSFSELVLAVAPLLPQLVEIAAELLPPLLDLFIALLPQLLKLIDAFTWLVTNVIEPLVIPALQHLADSFGDQLQNAATAVTTARDLIGSALDAMGRFFGNLDDEVAKTWDSIVRNVAEGVRVIGLLLQTAGSVPLPYPGKEAAKASGDAMIRWADDHKATGGLLSGKGTGTSDSMLIAASNGEFVVKASATSKNLPLLEAINAGWVPSAAFLHGMLPGFAEGGMVPGKKFAQSMDPVPYLMGGYSRQAIDCSGMVAAVVNDALGLDPWSGRMSTINEGSWLKAKGAKPGLGGAGDISVGWFDRGGGANGHTAMTLGDGTNVESRGGAGVVVGAGAAGANDKMFDQRMHIPAALLRGGDLGGPASAGRGLGASGGPSRGLGGGASPGAAPGAGAPTSTAPGTTTPGATTSNPLGGPATTANPIPVFVTNLTTSGLTTGGPASPTDLAVDALTTSTPSMSPSATPPAASTPEAALRQAGVLGPTSPSTPSPGMSPSAPQSQGSHPLANLPVPGASELFNGPAPWYLAGSPEQALTNLGTQAASLAQRTGSDVMGFFQNNWKEMLNTGLAVAGMGAGGGGSGPQMIVNNTGMDPQSAAAAVERVQRRRTLADQRGGGFGR